MEQLFAGGGALQVFFFGADSSASPWRSHWGHRLRSQADIVGTIVLGFRDCLRRRAVSSAICCCRITGFPLEYPEVILICICLAVFVFYFRGLFRHTGQVLPFRRRASVALFALAGANKAFACGEGFVMVVILGCATSVGGGRSARYLGGGDAGRVPALNFYAVAYLAARSCSRPWLSAKAPLVLRMAAACVFTVVFLLPVGTSIGSIPSRLTTPKVARGANGQALPAPSCFARATPASQEGARYPRLVVSPSKGLAYATAHSHRVHGGTHRHD